MITNHLNILHLKYMLYRDFDQTFGKESAVLWSQRKERRVEEKVEKWNRLKLADLHLIQYFNDQTTANPLENVKST